MLTTSPSSVVQKRDLHIGGIGASASGALAAVTDPPLADVQQTLLERARGAARDTDNAVRRNPWVALAVVAAAGLAAGYFLSRRS